jgi:AbrB family looped-hinge helix DNA binding protein
MLTSKLSKKGQVVIPKEIREKLGIKPGDVVVFREEGGRVYIDTIAGKLTEILKAGKPVEESSVEFQRKLRDEWE